MCFLPSLLSFRHWKFLVAPPCWYTAALVVLDVTDTDVFTPHPPTSHQMGFLAAAAMNIRTTADNAAVAWLSNPGRDGGGGGGSKREEGGGVRTEP